MGEPEVVDGVVAPAMGDGKKLITELTWNKENTILDHPAQLRSAAAVALEYPTVIVPVMAGQDGGFRLCFLRLLHLRSSQMKRSVTDQRFHSEALLWTNWNRNILMLYRIDRMM